MMPHQLCAGNVLRIVFAIAALLFLLSLTISPVQAGKESSLVEISHSSVSDTLESVTTYSLYSSPSRNLGDALYVGVQLASFKTSSTANRESLVRIVSGIIIPGRFSPYMEIGTDFVGLILLTDNQEKDCSTDHNCGIDAHFRGGIRFLVTRELHIGVFHEVISFGDFHDNLKGDHNYTGASVSFSF